MVDFWHVTHILPHAQRRTWDVLVTLGTPVITYHRHNFTSRALDSPRHPFFSVTTQASPSSVSLSSLSYSSRSLALSISRSSALSHSWSETLSHSFSLAFSRPRCQAFKFDLSLSAALNFSLHASWRVHKGPRVWAGCVSRSMWVLGCCPEWGRARAILCWATGCKAKAGGDVGPPRTTCTSIGTF